MTITIDAKAFLKAAGCRSTDENRFVLNGVLCENGRCVATDGRTLIVVKAPGNTGLDTAINIKVTKEVLNVMRECVKQNKRTPAFIDCEVYDKSNELEEIKEIHIKSNDIIAITQDCGTFPNYKQILPELQHAQNVGMIDFDIDLLNHFGKCKVTIMTTGTRAPVYVVPCDSDEQTQWVGVIMPLKNMDDYQCQKLSAMRAWVMTEAKSEAEQTESQQVS